MKKHITLLFLACSRSNPAFLVDAGADNGLGQVTRPSLVDTVHAEVGLDTEADVSPVADVGPAVDLAPGVDITPAVDVGTKVDVATGLTWAPCTTNKDCVSGNCSKNPKQPVCADVGMAAICGKDHPECASDLYPEMPSFQVDVAEVTSAGYVACMNAGKCTPWQYNPLCSQGIGPGDNQVAFCITWYNAFSYCDWLGKRLPKRDQWRKAWNWTATKYPWGDEPPTCDRANTTGCQYPLGRGFQLAKAVPLGDNLYGIHHLMGNVSEWLVDSADPPNQTYKLYVGGDMQTTPVSGVDDVSKWIPTSAWGATGFRCVL